MMDPGGVLPGLSALSALTDSLTQAGVTSGAPIADAYRHFSVRPAAGVTTRVYSAGSGSTHGAPAGGDGVNGAGAAGSGIWLSTTPPLRDMSSARDADSSRPKPER